MNKIRCWPVQKSITCLLIQCELLTNKASEKILRFLLSKWATNLVSPVYANLEKFCFHYFKTALLMASKDQWVDLKPWTVMRWINERNSCLQSLTVSSVPVSSGGKSSQFRISGKLLKPSRSRDTAWAVSGWFRSIWFICPETLYFTR